MIVEIVPHADSTSPKSLNVPTTCIFGLSLLFIIFFIIIIIIIIAFTSCFYMESIKNICEPIVSFE